MVRDGKMTVIDEPDGSHLYLSTDMSLKDLSEQFWSQRWSRWREAGLYWALAIFGAPAVLFVLGSGLLWVDRGFKSAK